MKNRHFNFIFFLLAILLLIVSSWSCKKNDTPPQPKTPPSQVLGLSVFARDMADSLIWSAGNTSEGVTSYKLYAGSNVTGLVALTTTTINNFLRTGLTNGTTYYYQVAAVNAAGEGPKSDVVSSTPQPPLNKQISISIPASLPGSMRLLPWRYYDPTSRHFGNPFVFTDSFKTVIQARVIDGFDSLFSQKIIDAGIKLPAGTVVLQDLRLGTINYGGSANIWQVEKILPRIVEYSNGIPGEANFTLYGVIDTIPMAVEITGAGLTGKQPNQIIESVHLVVKGWNGGSGGRKSLINKIIQVGEFAVNNTASAFDKKTPTIYTLNGRWYIVHPTNSRGGGSGNGTSGNTDYTISILFKEGTKLERTVFSFE